MKSPLVALAVGLSVTSLAALAAAPGCAQPSTNLASTAAGAGAGVGSSGSGGGAPNQGEAMFKALESDFVAACGTCHDAGGIADTPFLAGPDRHQSAVSWPGFITKDPTQSVLVKHPVSGGGHSGTNLDSPQLDGTLFPAIQAWLAEEAKSISSDPVVDAGKYIDPFAPILGFNAVYLGPLGAEYEGMALTFTANELGPDSIELSELEVHPTSKIGVHLVHPLFVVYPAGGSPDPDPVDSFSNVDQSFEAGQSGALGPGLVVLTNWKQDAKLSVAFEKLEAIAPDSPDGGDGGAALGGCKDTDSFIANAEGPLENNCFGCHGGNNAQAQGAVDMSKLMSDPASACSQVRNRVDPTDPPSSQLFVTTDPGGNAAHPYKFGGDGGKFGSFKSAVSTWITAEQ